MTCRDCIHYDVCRDEHKDKLRCSDFKNKADFVEVVRCKDCRYLLKDTMICSNKNNMTSINKRVYYGHFCSYGERE